MNLTPEQFTWLSANKSGYELVLMHSILHDKSRRSAMLSVPLGPLDFESLELGAILSGLIMAESIMSRMGATMPFPPTVDQLKSYMFAATKEKDSAVAEDDLPGAYRVLEELQSPRRNDQWYFLDTYFVAWLSSVRAKGYARRAQKNQIADAAEMSQLIDRDIRKANSAIWTPDSDDMYQALYGTSEVGKTRRPTGFPALDEALNGGWGEAECYGLMAGTGGGKSVLAGQVAYYEASTGGAPLILTTELPVVEYMVRMISNSCNVKIPLIQDCLNMNQVKMVLAAQDPAALSRFEVAFKVITEKMRIVKLHPDQGLDARAIMEQQTQLFEQRMGRKPTLVIFDWLGRVADVASTGKQSDRTVAWEVAADSCVQFSEIGGIPSLILLQAVNNANTKKVLSIEDTGISKGVWKQMVMGFAITNCVDHAAVKQALLTGALPGTLRTTPDDQLFCIIKSRKGEGTYIPVKRQMLYQRFRSGRDG